MFTKAEWDKSFIFNSIRLRREWLLKSSRSGCQTPHHRTRPLYSTCRSNKD
jgi:hypothetical protein